MKFYDKNGKIHKSLLEATISNIATNTVINISTSPPKKEEPIKTVETKDYIKGIRVEIDQDKKKIYLLDAAGITIFESDIDEKLTSKMNYGDTDIAAVDPKLTQPDFISEILNSERVKKNIDQFLLNNQAKPDDSKVGLFGKALKKLGIN